ncbi:MAG: hypothetical protein RIS56_1692, partial [Verrucomicrobiota bacterium]
KSRAMSPRQPEVPNLIEVTGELSTASPKISSRPRPFLELGIVRRVHTRAPQPNSDQVGLAGHADLVLSLDPSGLEALVGGGVAGDDAVELLLAGPEMIADHLAHH